MNNIHHLDSGFFAAHLLHSLYSILAPLLCSIYIYDYIEHYIDKFVIFVDFDIVLSSLAIFFHRFLSQCQCVSITFEGNTNSSEPKSIKYCSSVVFHKLLLSLHPRWISFTDLAVHVQESE